MTQPLDFPDWTRGVVTIPRVQTVMPSTEATTSPWLSPAMDVSLYESIEVVYGYTEGSTTPLFLVELYWYDDGVQVGVDSFTDSILTGYTGMGQAGAATFPVHGSQLVIKVMSSTGGVNIQIQVIGAQRTVPSPTFASVGENETRQMGESGGIGIVAGGSQVFYFPPMTKGWYYAQQACPQPLTVEVWTMPAPGIIASYAWVLQELLAANTPYNYNMIIPGLATRLEISNTGTVATTVNMAVTRT